MTDTPPCVTLGAPLNACAKDLYRLRVQGIAPLGGPWTGWRLAGRELVSPDGDRICPERLRGLLFTEHNRKRINSGSAGAVRGPGVVIAFRRVQHKGG